MGPGNWKLRVLASHTHDHLSSLLLAWYRFLQVAWIRYCVREYMHQRTNLTHAPAKGSVIAPVEPWSEEGLHRLRWATLGAEFDWTSRTYIAPSEGSQPRPFPAELTALAREVYAAVGAPFSEDFGMISVGLSAVYLLGQDTYDVPPTPLWLRSGDLVIMSGPSRWYGAVLVAHAQHSPGPSVHMCVCGAQTEACSVRALLCKTTARPHLVRLLWKYGNGVLLAHAHNTRQAVCKTIPQSSPGPRTLPLHCRTQERARRAPDIGRLLPARTSGPHPGVARR